MAKFQKSAKHLQINRANTVVVVTIAIAAFVTTFSIVAARAILIKRSYQSRVITEKTKAADQLKANIEAVDKLQASYSAFVEQQENIIGGSSAGQGERDGDNAKIILDALPSSYDFPALTSSLEKILTTNSLGEGSINGTDDEVAQQEVANTATAPVDMPVQLSVAGSYESMLNFIRELSLSIRPMHITKLQLTGKDEDIQVTLDVKTYYQPQKKLNITKKTVE